MRPFFVPSPFSISAASEKYAKWHSEMVQQAVAYDNQELDASTRRALDLLKLGTSAPAPNDAAKRKEIAQVSLADLGLVPNLGPIAYLGF